MFFSSRRRSRQRKTKSRPRTFRPRLEALEERALMTQRIWDGGALLNDKWTDASNWEGNVAPLENDELFFPEANVGVLDRSTNNDFPIGTKFNKITINGNNYTFSGNRITMGSFGLHVLPASTITGNFVSHIEFNITLPGGSTVVEVLKNSAQSSNLFIEGNLSGPGGITKQGTGNLGFGGTFNNSYSGITRVELGQLSLSKTGVAVPGPLIIGDSVNPAQVNVNLDNQISDTSDVEFRPGAKLQFFNSSSDAIGNLTMNAANVVGPGKLTFKGDVTVTGLSRITANVGLGKPVVKFTVNVNGNFGNLVVDGAISGPGIVEKSGSGDLTYAGNTSNTYTSETRVFQGQLILLKSSSTSAKAIVGHLVVGPENGSGLLERVIVRDDKQFADTASIRVNRSGRLQIETQVTRIGPLTLNGGSVLAFVDASLELNGSLATIPSPIEASIANLNLFLSSTSGTINVGDGAAERDLVISAAIVGANSGLTKTNTGTLVLTNQNPYMGPTKLDGGKLLINGTHANSPVFVNGSLAVLGGTGTLAGVQMNGGTIDPGASPGVLTVNSLIAPVGSFAKFRFEINGTAAGTQFDQLKINSANQFGVSLGLFSNPTLNVILGGGFAPALGTQFKIVDIGAGLPSANGVFKSPQGTLLNEGSSLTINGQTFTISYVGGDGNDVVLTRNDPPAFQNRTVTPLVPEGGIATLTGTITEPNAGDTFFLDVNWGDGSAKETFTFPPGTSRNVSVTHKYLDDNPSVTPQDRYTIRLLWRDQHGGSNTGALPIVVRNVAPNLSNLTFSSPVVPGQPANLSGLISDPGVRDTFQLRVDWRDGSAPETFNFPAGTTSFSLTHRFAKPGNRAVTLVLKDDDNGVTVATTRVKVNASAAASSIGSAPLNLTAIDLFFALDPLAFEPLIPGRKR